MPRVKKCSDSASLDTHFGDGEDYLGTIQTLQPIYTDKTRDADLLDFDTDKALYEMFPDKRDSPEEQVKTCPRCDETMLYDEVTTKNDTQWGYYRCTTLNDYTKCYVTCGVDDVDLYLDKVRDTLHPIYLGGDDCFPSSNMRCYCHLSLILVLSKSVKNNNRLYFKCPKTKCQFFQWADEEPVGRVRRWLVQGVNPDAKHKEQRHKPYDLDKPVQTRRPFEARPRR